MPWPESGNCTRRGASAGGGGSGKGRTIARLAEAAVTAWEAREGRISTEENGPPLPPLARLSQTEQRRWIMGGARCCRQRQGWEKTLWTADDNGSTADGDKVLTFWLDAVE